MYTIAEILMLILCGIGTLIIVILTGYGVYLAVEMEESRKAAERAKPVNEAAELTFPCGSRFEEWATVERLLWEDKHRNHKGRFIQ